MPRAKAETASWNGTPPVSREGFAFADNEFFAETSAKNRHRRATPAELGTHFAPASKDDRPAHWYEAQLIHYGLQPSKTKSVARMRLFDAVNVSTLKVPAHITKLESTLKKEWNKNNRGAKKAEASTSTKPKVATQYETKAATSSMKTAVNSATASKNTTSKTATTRKAAAKSSTSKRKAEVGDENLGSGAAKKAKTNKDAPRVSSSSQTSTATVGRTKQTARRGGLSGGRGRGAPVAPTLTSSPPTPARPRTTARRGGFRARDIPPGKTVENMIENRPVGNSPPPPYFQEDPYPWSGHSSGADSHDDDCSSGDEFGDGHIGRLGLLNGRYHVTSRFVTSEWDFFNAQHFTLGFTLSGTSLWGHFDLGVIEGILYLRDRPWDASDDLVPFIWRGREQQGPIVYGNSNEGWLKFLGDGRVEGRFDMMGITFRGQRVPNQGTRPDVDARALQNEWNSYTEDEYERENRARWG